MNLLYTYWKKKNNLRAKIFTQFVKRYFKHFGTHSYLFPPIMALKGLNKIEIGNHVSFGSNLQLTVWDDGCIIIGDGCKIREYCHITAKNRIVIGQNLLTGTNVLITDNSHGAFVREQLNIHPAERPIVSKGAVTIGNNVWLGNNVCVMPGVTIGDGVIVGANSVVTHDIPAYSMAVGIPAKIVKQLCD